MNDIPDVEITGDVYKLNFEIGADGTAAFVAWTKGKGGRIGRSWIRLDESAVRYLANRMEATKRRD
ncbi:hypothetical protein [Yinghuangia sp. YIM S10712]|uniref:hypothetical protein n=1 Tax=Yinghuangia sp. YIM S10712 TaxID=3436930 RepID=UPI003F52DFB1